jgi:hypothetical protein
VFPWTCRKTITICTRTWITAIRISIHIYPLIYILIYPHITTIDTTSIRSICILSMATIFTTTTMTGRKIDSTVTAGDAARHHQVHHHPPVTPQDADHAPQPHHPIDPRNLSTARKSSSQEKSVRRRA